MEAPFAVVTEADGDVVFPVNPEAKGDLQSLFDEVTAACVGKKLRKRTGQCELDYLSQPGVGGGVLEFDIPGISIPTFTMGDVSVALQSVPAAVAIAFLAYVIGDGKVVDNVAPKVGNQDNNPASQTQSSEKIVPTTTYEDQEDSLFTADAAIYTAMAQEILDRIAQGDPDHLWSDDQTSIPTASCDKDKVTNAGSDIIQE